MKKLLYLLSLLTFISCDRKINPAPDPLPTQQSLARRQAPFGVNPVDVKVTKVLTNGALDVEYTYEGDFLLGEKRFQLDKKLIMYQTGIFARNQDFVTGYQTTLADYNPETGLHSDTLSPYYSISYPAPKNDSIQIVTREDLRSKYKTFVHYNFNQKGFVTKIAHYFDEKTNLSSDILLIRDANNNITRSWLKETLSSKTGEIAYTYDNHPNPFFKLGIDWAGETSIRSLSPNNILVQTHLSPSGSVLSTFTYRYEYLPNGYPAKATVFVESVNVPSYNYTLEFQY